MSSSPLRQPVALVDAVPDLRHLGKDGLKSSSSSRAFQWRCASNHQRPRESPGWLILTCGDSLGFESYEIASNRGARHDADEIDANEMDARTVLALCAWILSEMVRFSQKGNDLTLPKKIVDGLMKQISIC